MRKNITFELDARNKFSQTINLSGINSKIVCYDLDYHYLIPNDYHLNKVD